MWGDGVFNLGTDKFEVPVRPLAGDVQKTLTCVTDALAWALSEARDWEAISTEVVNGGPAL